MSGLTAGRPVQIRRERVPVSGPTRTPEDAVRITDSFQLAIQGVVRSQMEIPRLVVREVSELLGGSVDDLPRPSRSDWERMAALANGLGERIHGAGMIPKATRDAYLAAVGGLSAEESSVLEIGLQRLDDRTFYEITGKGAFGETSMLELAWAIELPIQRIAGQTTVSSSVVAGVVSSADQLQQQLMLFATQLETPFFSERTAEAVRADAAQGLRSSEAVHQVS